MPVMGRAGYPAQPSGSQTLGQAYHHPQYLTTGAVTPPTFPSAADLAEGTGTRAFGAQTTAAGDWLVCEVVAEANTVGETYPPTCAGLTFALQADSGTGGSTDVHVLQYAAQDLTGASRTVTVTPSNGARNYRARVTVVRGSDGPGSGRGASQTAQSLTIVRQGDSSALFIAGGDFSAAGSVASVTWLPSGTTVASQDGVAADYVFGRLDNAGAAASATTGVNTPALNTPAVAVLEMLGTKTAAVVADVMPDLVMAAMYSA